MFGVSAAAEVHGRSRSEAEKTTLEHPDLPLPRGGSQLPPGHCGVAGHTSCMSRVLPHGSGYRFWVGSSSSCRASWPLMNMWQLGPVVMMSAVWWA